MSVKLEVFTSQSCPYCPMAVAAAEKAVEELGDDVDYQHLNVDENLDKVREYQIMSVPTIVVDGEVAFIGAPEPEEIVRKIKKTLLRKKWIIKHPHPFFKLYEILTSVFIKIILVSIDKH